MEHQKLNIEYKDLMQEDNIIELIRKKVDDLVKSYWGHDECQPIFIVSILFDKNIRTKEDRQYIVLTCTHLYSSFSRVLFPVDENFYGYESILEAMKCLYNQTM